jgi:hypothetical protein
METINSQLFSIIKKTGNQSQNPGDLLLRGLEMLLTVSASITTISDLKIPSDSRSDRTSTPLNRLKVYLQLGSVNYSHLNHNQLATGACLKTHNQALHIGQIRDGPKVQIASTE